MAKIRYLLEVYKKLSGDYARQYVYATTPTETITDGIQFDFDNSIESSKDGFSIRIANAILPDGSYAYKEKIVVDDRILLYVTSKADITDANKSNYQLYDGLVIESSYDVTSGGRFLTLKGANRFQKIMDFTWPAVYRQQTASEIVANLIQQVNDGNPLNTITWAPDNSSTDEKIDYSRSYRPVYEMIEELSDQKFNLEFNAYYYVNYANQLVWKQKTKDTDTISLVEGVDFDNIKISEKVRDVINAIIASAGKDPSNRDIHAMYYDEESAAEYGLKWASTIETFAEIATTVIQQCRDSSSGPEGGWVNNSDSNKANFPADSAYPLTLPFLEKNNHGTVIGDYVVVTTDSEYVIAIRRESRARCISKIKSILDRTGFIRPLVTIEMAGATWETGAGRTGTSAENCLDSSGDPLKQGDAVTLFVPSYNNQYTTGVIMRCVRLSHEIDKEGWIVQVMLEMDMEDAKTYVANLGG
jgi:hypothetical protein